MQISIQQTDITTLKVDAIVNAANSSLLGGGGVDGAIHKAAGPELVRFCRTLNGCLTGQAKITPGFNLPCRHIIHTVGPVWQGGDQGEAELLSACYQNCLALAHTHQLSSLAFPAISTGVYGFPKAQAAEIAVGAVRGWQADLPRAVIFVCFDAETQALYQALLAGTGLGRAD